MTDTRVQELEAEIKRWEAEAEQWRQPPPPDDCICDYSPHSTGPEQDCPQHGDVRWFSAWWSQTAEELDRVRAALAQSEARIAELKGQIESRALWTERDALLARIADLQAVIKRSRQAYNAIDRVHRAAMKHLGESLARIAELEAEPPLPQIHEEGTTVHVEWPNGRPPYCHVSPETLEARFAEIGELRQRVAELEAIKKALINQTAKDAAALAAVRGLLDPEAGMASTPFGRGERYFSERHIRAALDTTTEAGNG